MKEQPQSIIKRIAETNSKNEKQDILVELLKDDDYKEFFDGLRMCFSSFDTYGVKKVPEKTEDEGQGLPWVAFVDLQSKLANRDLTGHDARDAILLSMDVATQEQWNGWYRRILIKDMRAGFSESTVNKACKKAKKEDWGVPIFECQLAHDGANHESKISGKKLIEVKLDGVRVITIVRTDGLVEMFSRNGKKFENFGHIEDQISAVVKETALPYDVVLDGEIMSATFQDLMTQVNRKSNVDAKDAVLHLFDFIPYTDFMKKEWDQTQLVRTQMVQAWVNTHQTKLPNVKALSYEDVNLNTEVGKIRFAEINKLAIEGGYEGIMIKDPKAGYKSKRSVSWLKIKPYIEVSLTVVGFEEGTGKNKDKLGALVCLGVDDGKTINVSVGGGFSDQQREDYWNNKDSIKGMVAEIRGDAITQNRNSNDYSIRFPRFKTFRGFTAGQKI